MLSAFEATISGRVQGVLFRDFVRRKAQALHIVGGVENKEDGTVYLYAEGDEETLNTFLGYLDRGSAFSRVDSVAYQFVHPKGGFKTFSINYT